MEDVYLASNWRLMTHPVHGKCQMMPPSQGRLHRGMLRAACEGGHQRPNDSNGDDDKRWRTHAPKQRLSPVKRGADFAHHKPNLPACDRGHQRLTARNGDDEWWRVRTTAQRLNSWTEEDVDLLRARLMRVEFTFASC
jgi:hypothetical protein